MWGRLCCVTGRIGVEWAHSEETFAHTHEAPGLSPARRIETMNAVPVTKAVRFARKGATDDEVLQGSNGYPDRIMPAMGLQNQGWRGQRPGFLHQVAQKLHLGRDRCTGELL